MSYLKQKHIYLYYISLALSLGQFFVAIFNACVGLHLKKWIFSEF